MLLFLNVIYVLIAVAMIALILMQRGAGAQAGSGFGAGASGTVFGARGASNFLSKSTKWLAVAFFGISLFMAWSAGQSSRAGAKATTVVEQPSSSVMSQIPAAPGQTPSGQPTPAAAVPSAPAQAVPSAPAQTAPVTPPADAAPPAEVPPAAPQSAPAGTPPQG